MIKIFVRAIVPVQSTYLLMGDKDKEGKEVWDLPGGELKPGIDVRDLLQKLVLENTGYIIGNINFFEITSKVRPRTRANDAETIIDFIFTSKLETLEAQAATKQTDLLPFEKFEWLESEGRFQQNKAMALLSRYHQQHNH